MIERCLQLYMNKDEVVKTLLSRAKIDPGFTTLGKYLETLLRFCVFKLSESVCVLFYFYV